MKKYVNLIILVFLAGFLLAGCSGKDEEALVFKDKQFEKMLQEEIGSEKIYKSDLAEVSGILIAADRVLDLTGGGYKDNKIILYGYDEFEYGGTRYKETGSIKTLEDLKHFPRLSSIRIYRQPEVDFNTIPSKSGIINLGLSQNNLGNLDFLTGFDNLLYLSVSSNKLTDIKGVENAPKLKLLNLNSNEVASVATLSQLKELENLDLTYNSVTDISPLKGLSKLTYLSLYENGLKDISPISEMKSLKELYLNNNKITDLSPLKGFSTFDSLNVSGNPVKSYDPVSHIDNLVK